MWTSTAQRAPTATAETTLQPLAGAGPDPDLQQQAAVAGRPAINIPKAGAGAATGAAMQTAPTSCGCCSCVVGCRCVRVPCGVCVGGEGPCDWPQAGSSADLRLPLPVALDSAWGGCTAEQLETSRQKRQQVGQCRAAGVLPVTTRL